MTNWILPFLRKNNFVLLMMMAVGLGLLTPGWGARGGHLHSEWLTRMGVFVIFLVQGVSLSTESLQRGISQWRLHLFTQIWISLGVPLIVLVARLLSGGWGGADLWTGLWFLAVLPTTVSSAVALISHAEGNVAAGVFNTVCSNLLAVILVPAWIIGYEAASGAQMPDLWPIFRQLLLLLLLPFLIGHFLHAPLQRVQSHIRRFSRPLTQGIILFMVYAAFANSRADAIWETVGIEHTFVAGGAAAGLLVVVSLLVLLSARWAFGVAPDRIAAFYCGSHKSLATGIPFAMAIYGSERGAGLVSIVILPLMFYHPFQLFLGALLVRWRSYLFGLD